MRPPSNPPPSIYSDRDRNIPSHLPSSSSSPIPQGHYRSGSSNDTQFQGRTLSHLVYPNPSGYPTPQNAFRPMPLGPTTTSPHLHRTYSGGDSFHDARSRYPGSQQMSTRGFSESQAHPSIGGGPSTLGRSTYENPSTSTSPGKYECAYCGKGFNRPSSLKVNMLWNTHSRT